MAYCFGDGTSTDINPAGVDYVRGWTRMKYGVDLPAEQIRNNSLRKLYDELVGYQDQWLHQGRLEQEVDSILAANTEPQAIAKAMKRALRDAAQRRGD